MKRSTAYFLILSQSTALIEIFEYIASFTHVYYLAQNHRSSSEFIVNDDVLLCFLCSLLLNKLASSHFHNYINLYTRIN